MKFSGLLIAFLALLGLIHLFSGDSAQEYLQMAHAGSGGGYAGYFLAALFLKLAGKGAGALLLLALFAAGLIASFNLSFQRLIDRLKALTEAVLHRKVPEEEVLEDAVEEAIDDPALSLDLREEGFAPASVSGDDLAGANIQNLNFHDEELQAAPQELESEEGDEEEGDGEGAPKKRRRRRTHWVLPERTFFRIALLVVSVAILNAIRKLSRIPLSISGIEVEAGEVKEGPTVTQYTFRPGIGVKLSRITNLSNDLALALAKHPIRIEAPIPNQPLIGIEVPNIEVARVRLRSVLETPEFKKAKSESKLSLILG